MSKLKTVWVPLATSGPVVDGANDGRFMKKEWLQDMADTYNTKVHTAKLWPEHRRHYSGGTVLALKVEPAIVPELKGELQLFGILSPADWIIHANRSGDYTFPSIEVGENYRNTGKFYLKGLGLTDQPASSGVTELNFSTKDGTETAHIVSGHQFDLSQLIDKDTDDGQSLLRRVFSAFSAPSNNSPESEDDTMTKEQMDELQAALKTHIDNSMDTRFATLSTEIKESGKAEGNAGDEEGSEAGGDASKDFSKLQEENESLKTRIDDLEKKFSAMSDEPDGKSTPTGEGKGDGAAVEVI